MMEETHDMMIWLVTEFTKPKIAAWIGMTDGCDGSTWLGYMDNLVMDIRLETWSMVVLCRDIMQEHL